MAFTVPIQEKNYWCWAAVSVALQKYYYPASQVSQTDMANALFASPADKAAELDDALSVFQQNKLAGAGALQLDTSKGKLSFAEIEKQLESCLPICVLIGGTQGVGHFVVISGCQTLATGDQILEIADPAYGDDQWPYAQFPEYYKKSGKWLATYVVSK